MKASQLFTQICLSVSLFSPVGAMAASIVGNGDKYFPEIEIKGNIIDGDESRLSAAISQIQLLNPSSGISFRLDSEGGDVAVAMAMGRVIRAIEATTDASKCYSSCVLVLAGGVYRSAVARKDYSTVAVHRIYFETMGKDATVTAIRSARDTQIAKVRYYLKEMDIDTALLDEMESIPPEKLKFLTEDEMTRYRVTGVDASWDEKMTAKNAWSQGISSLEYRRRAQRVKQICGDYATHLQNNTSQGKYLPCSKSVMLNISLDAARNVISTIRSRCISMPNGPAKEECIREVNIKATRAK